MSSGLSLQPSRALCLTLGTTVFMGAMLFAGGVALGSQGTFPVNMSGPQEVPGPGDADGVASGTITLNDVTGVVSWDFTYANISPPTLMHIHTGPAGVGGGVLINLGVATSGGPGTLISSTVHGNLLQITNVLNNPPGFYVNIHNGPFPSGAVRGQLVQPPFCGNGILDPGEQCDLPFDFACPGLCVPPGPPNQCTCLATNVPCCLPQGIVVNVPESECPPGNILDHGVDGERCIPTGDDCLSTPCGATRADFCETPIPAGFFGPGSLPFEGIIVLGGDGTPDTTIRRFNAMLLDGPPETIPIELVQLNLSSCSPITVNINNVPTLWDVDMTLSLIPVQPGSMTVTKQHPNGGVFTSQFNVRPHFTFTEVGQPGNSVIFEPPNPDFLVTLGSGTWVYDSQGEIQPQCGVNFLPGVQPAEGQTAAHLCCTTVCHAGATATHCIKHTVCAPCPHGACCNTANGSCTVVDEVDCMGEYMGHGTTCEDGDGDGIADILETGTCCSPDRNECRTGTDPNNPDTDGDGLLDGVELKKTKCDPCVPDSVDTDGDLIPDDCGFMHYVKFSQPPKPNPSPCPCNGDVDNSGGNANLIDLSKVIDCVQNGICSGCVNSCDVNCDGALDQADIDAAVCRVQLQPPNVCCPQLPPGEDYPSNIDWGDMIPNQVAADDFTSDGRPITAVRWWGSNRDKAPPVIKQGIDVQSGVDLWHTPAGSSYQDFTGTPIPADFFDPGSDPFTGIVDFEGVSLSASPSLGATDTIVERLASAPMPDCPDSSAIVPIMIRALSLQSVAPMTVTYFGGVNPELWDVRVFLAGGPQQLGDMTIQQLCSGGGIYNATLPVHWKAELTRQSDLEVRVFDTFAEGLAPTVFTASGKWVYLPDLGFGATQAAPGTQVDTDGDGLFDTIIVGSSNFFPGFEEKGCISCNIPLPPPPNQNKPPLTQEQAQWAAHGVNPPNVCDLGFCCIPFNACFCADPVQCNGQGGFHVQDCAGCPSPNESRRNVRVQSREAQDGVAAVVPLAALPSPSVDRAWELMNVEGVVDSIEPNALDTALPRGTTKETRVDPPSDLEAQDVEPIDDPDVVAAPPLASNFAGIIDNRQGNSIPPDTHGAVGPNHIVEIVNSGSLAGDPGFAVFDRGGGTVMGPITIQGFWTALGVAAGQPASRPFDPKVVYDQYVDRWIAVTDGNPDARDGTINSWLLVGISQTNTPTGPWNLYRIKADILDGAVDHRRDWCDYPGIGVDPNNVIITNNMFDVTRCAGGANAGNICTVNANCPLSFCATGHCQANPGILCNANAQCPAGDICHPFRHADVWVIDKASLIAGPGPVLIQGVDYALFHDPCGTGGGVFQPCHTFGQSPANAQNYLVQEWDSGQLRVKSITGVGAAAVLGCAGGNDYIAVNPFGTTLPGAPQPNCASLIHTGDTRLLNAVLWKDTIWTTHTVEAGGKTEVAWYEINPGAIAALPGGLPNQQGRVNHPTRSYYYPSIAVNKNQCVALGFSGSGTTKFASGFYTARFPTDPPGTMQPVNELKAGVAPYLKTFGGGRNRWGDYSATVVDPLDYQTFWTVQEYAEAQFGGALPGACVAEQGRWGTWWGSFQCENRIDGWFISFHEHLQKNDPIDEPLALYYCDIKVVDMVETKLPDCQDHQVWDYFVNLDQCCLIHANVDSRTGDIPATKGAFFEEKCLEYHIDIQAVVGHKFVQDKETGQCVEYPTGHGAADDFWGWHTTINDCMKGAFDTMVTMGPLNEWLYGPWANITPKCTFANMAFELYTNTPPVGVPDADSNCIPDQCEKQPPNDIVWVPTRSCTGGPVPNMACTVDADCAPGGTCTPWPNNNPLATTRSLRFTVTGPPGPSKLDAIKVTMVDLQHPRPANLPAQPPPNFTTYDTRLNGVCVGGTLPGHHCDTNADCPGGGTCSPLVACTADPACTDPLDCTLPSNSCARWVGKPGTFYEFQGPPLSGPYRAARLQCTPFYWDWKSEGLITAVGAEIAPSSEYSVQDYSAACMGIEATCTNVSAPVTMYTRRSGDVDRPFNPPAGSGQPDVTDITQLVNKFKNLPGALVKAITQVQPNLPELNTNINVLDILAVVDAFRGVKYAFSGPCVCPSAVPCTPAPGSVACASPTPCVTAFGAGSTCVKTCTGPGPLAGDPCIDNTHCLGSGTCGSGFCRDRCGRCTP